MLLNKVIIGFIAQNQDTLLNIARDALFPERISHTFVYKTIMAISENTETPRLLKVMLISLGKNTSLISPLGIIL